MILNYLNIKKQIKLQLPAMLFQKKNNRGFTLIEMLVTIAIISVLLGVVLVSVSGIKKNSNDKVRTSDIKQLELTFKLYKEAFGFYPVLTTSPQEIGVGSQIDVELKKIQSNLSVDPKSDKNKNSNSGVYSYSYDTNFTCTQSGQKIIYVKKFETITSYSNGGSLCTANANNNQPWLMDRQIIILE